MVGVVERDDLGHAIAHGLATPRCAAVMSAEVAAVRRDASLAERAAIAAARSRPPAGDRVRAARAAPVDQVLGIITRGDLLRALRERAGGRAARGDASSSATGCARCPGWSCCGRPSRAAAGEDGLYLVGGAVRDLLLEEPGFDVDLAVEGDGVAFAGRLARELGGRSHAHEKFHTAVVIVGDLRVDVASARTEHYEYPAALPMVEHSSIRQDLHRRDFTINAMAVSLLPAEFGVLLDPYGGAGDLGRASCGCCTTSR